MTGRDAVSAALRKIGVLASSESLAASDAADGLAELNRMIGNWSTEGLLIHAITAEAPLVLTPGDATYTLGASGDITTRPQMIEKAIIRDASTQQDRPPMRILTLDEFASISDKNLRSAYPHSLYDDGGHPQRSVTLYPVPSAANLLVLFTRRALTSIATLDTSVALPPGYDDALVYNLAVRLAPEYGKPVPDAVAIIAVESKANIQRANHRPSYLECDSALVSRGAFNIYSGSYQR